MPIGDVEEDEMREYLKGYVAECREIEKAALKTDGIVLNEEKVPLFYRPEDDGTLDFCGIAGDYSWVQFIDLKYGAGIEVKAEENDQQMIYLLSLVRHYEQKGIQFPADCRVSLCIYQPRHWKFDGIDCWTVTLEDLRDYGIDILNDYRRSVDGDTTLVPSEKGCQFCEAKGICEARSKTNFGGLPPAINPLEEFNDESTEPANLVEFPGKFDVSLLTPEQVAWICTHGADMKKVIDDCIKNETARIKDGGEIRSHKLVGGNLGNRNWKDEKAAEKLIKAKLGVAETYPARKIITAPQALTKLKPMMDDLSTRFKNKLDELIHRPEGKPQLVPVDDEREALIFKSPEQDFDDESFADDPEIQSLL